MRIVDAAKLVVLYSVCAASAGCLPVEVARQREQQARMEAQLAAQQQINQLQSQWQAQVAEERRQRAAAEAQLDSARAETNDWKSRFSATLTEKDKSVANAFDTGFAKGQSRAGKEAVMEALADGGLVVLGGIAGAALFVLFIFRQMQRRDTAAIDARIRSIELLLLEKARSVSP